ncbi:hypothetical protein [Acetobacter sicerae]|uniref:hypothetical protein n=1 Tax=Acetobacter sicerae TaxID=85325 RepID=UPI00156B9019|nr:hypothetical protein [Acetobacter sicerae]
MKHEEFREGASFWTASGEWRCTDVGRRTIIAIQLEPQLDPSWFKGPPYAVGESVFDEYDLEGCYPSEAALLADIGGCRLVTACTVIVQRFCKPKAGA